MPGPLRWLLFAVVLTALPVTAGVLVLGEGEPDTAPPETAAPAYSSTPLGDLDTATVALARAPFCDRIPEEAVAEALDGKVGPTASYDAGQAAELAPGIKDVAHEHGCRIAGPGGTEVRAWVFVPPVTRDRATDLVTEAAGREGCSRATAPAYGDPSVALLCPSGKRTWVSFRGLFGDAWLACSLSAPSRLAEQELLDRTGRWCVAVAQAASVVE
ncbi:hypothetical protein DJ010_14905 [Nocardioides silvaticus]|uniref:DUF3558 domain-containing protein n=1 Tax=Nocardioides silvaticus TaxID=2201891 RepID=A0A316TRX1_9ACTN|nr:hypothetical protein [Nocardioides silvaticus]PWN02386.1 hypothetical protein DJ010_14905 [Nocardioides silvaticus]